MAESRSRIQNRISSVTSTRKITNAMQLVASSKLRKMRQNMENGREYANGMKNMLEHVLDNANGSKAFLQKNPEAPAFIFVITSDMGLCGAYNSNVFKKLKEVMKPDDLIVMIGSRGIGWARINHVHLYASLENLDEDIAFMDLSRIADQALEMYDEGKVSAIQVLYTRFENAIRFEPTLETLLPLPREASSSKGHTQVVFEPSREHMMHTIVPMAVRSSIFSLYQESKTSEQASRRLAMENATDNAGDLLDDLHLQANRIRQSAITQEITEIVGGANALAEEQN